MSVLVVKVYQPECPVCETMSRFDTSVMDGFSNIEFREVDFEDLSGNLDKPFNIRLYKLLEAYAVSASYEIDFPTYIFLEDGVNYLGHIQGAETLRSFRQRVKDIIEKV